MESPVWGWNVQEDPRPNFGPSPGLIHFLRLRGSTGMQVKLSLERHKIRSLPLLVYLWQFSWRCSKTDSFGISFLTSIINRHAL
jgi:hypothetical protein